MKGPTCLRTVVLKVINIVPFWGGGGLTISVIIVKIKV